MACSGGMFESILRPAKPQAFGRTSNSRASRVTGREQEPSRISTPNAERRLRSASSMKPHMSLVMPVASTRSQVASPVRSQFARNSCSCASSGSISSTPSHLAKNGLSIALRRPRATSTAIRCLRSIRGRAIGAILARARNLLLRKRSAQLSARHLNFDQSRIRAAISTWPRVSSAFDLDQSKRHPVVVEWIRGLSRIAYLDHSTPGSAADVQRKRTFDGYGADVQVHCIGCRLHGFPTVAGGSIVGAREPCGTRAGQSGDTFDRHRDVRGRRRLSAPARLLPDSLRAMSGISASISL